MSLVPIQPQNPSISPQQVTAGREWLDRQRGDSLDPDVRRSLRSCVTSFLVHILILVILACCWFPFGGPPGKSLFLTADYEESGRDANLDGAPGEVAIPLLASSMSGMPSSDPLFPSDTRIRITSPTDSNFNPQAISSASDFNSSHQTKMTLPFDRPTGGGWNGRLPENRTGLLDAGGGSAITEGAVQAGLEWLVRHQHENGSWTFSFDEKPCDRRCRHSSDMTNTTGATGLALLCFLGQGHTHHTESPYREAIENGIYYLIKRIGPTPHGGDLQEGTMYAHGIATLALCEAYGMSHDQSLRSYAQSCVDFICHAQHKHGGWRYSPGQQGDTTVFGWQMMALKSAKMAGLRVPTEITHNARRFLDHVGSEDGAFYGYLQSGIEPTPTSVGLLCRMYTGWPRNHRPLMRGVRYLAARGPSKTDLYFNYYANQVMFHYRLEGWTGWNHRLSGYLVRTQARLGHEMGSWYFEDPYAQEAGRHYVTCMAIMILEVYYRHMPLYQQRSIDERL